jgi:tetratricopeptide (TPR) repeat protein
VFVAVVAGPAAPASAQTPPSENPEELIKEGIRLRRAGDNYGALHYFEKAYRLDKSPRSAAQLGLCEFAVARWVDAEAHLSEALRATSDPWIAQYRKQLFDQVAAAKDYLGLLEVVGRPADAEVEVDGRTVGRLPLPKPLRIVGGREVYVRVTAPGYEPLRRAIKVERRELARIVVELERLPGNATEPRAIARPGKPPVPGGPGDKPNYDIEVPPEADEKAHWQTPAGWIGASVAGLALTTGVVGVFTANSNYQKFNDYRRSTITANGRCNTNAPNDGGNDCSRYLDSAELWKKVAVGSFITAGIAAGTALLLFTSVPDERGYAFSCSPSAGTLGGGCGWRF